MNRVRGFSTQRRDFSSFTSSSRKRNTKPSTGRRSLANVAWQPEEYSKVGLVRPKTKTKTNPPLLGGDWCRKRWLCACKQASAKSSTFPRIIANATIAVIIECHHNLSSNRLTEDPETQVLLLEAGPKYVSTHTYALLVCCLFWCQ